MSACPVLTEERLEQLAQGLLSAREQEALDAHLAGPCEACLARLETLDDDAYLAVLAGPGGEASPAELERLVASVTARAAPAPRPAARRWAPRVGAGLALAAALTLVMVGTLRTPGERIKSAVVEASAPEASLLVLAGPQDGEGQLRRLAEGEGVGAREQLFFRVHLEAPARVWLLSAGEAEPLWHSGEVLPAGDHEVAALGSALALPGEQVERGGAFVLVAAREPLASALLERLASLAPDREAMREACPACGVDLLQVEGP